MNKQITINRRWNRENINKHRSERVRVSFKTKRSTAMLSRMQPLSVKRKMKRSYHTERESTERLSHQVIQRVRRLSYPSPYLGSWVFVFCMYESLNCLTLPFTIHLSTVKCSSVFQISCFFSLLFDFFQDKNKTRNAFFPAL